MGIKKLTEKEEATTCKEGLHLLITQPETVDGEEMEAVRRLPVETFLQDVGVTQLKQDLSDVNKIAEKAYIMTDARDNKKYGMEWGVNKDGYPTVTFQEVTE